MSNRKFGKPRTQDFVCPFCRADIRGASEYDALMLHLRRGVDEDGYQLNVCMDYCSTRLPPLYGLDTKPNPL